MSDRTYRRAGQIRLCIRDSGTGSPVLLLHGTTATLGVWDGVVANLGGVRTIAVDQRGHGRSDKPGSGYDASHYCTDIIKLIADLDCGPVVVVGHSLGARNAVVLGAQRPDLVAGVLAVDYAPYVESEVLDSLQSRVRSGDRQFETAVDIRHYLRERYPLMPDDAIERRISYGYQNENGKFQALADPDAMQQTVAGLRRDFVDEMRNIPVPVTIVRGENSKIVSRNALAATRQLRPDIEVIELSDVDHYVPEEAPEQVAERIIALLR